MQLKRQTCDPSPPHELRHQTCGAADQELVRDNFLLAGNPYGSATTADPARPGFSTMESVRR